MLSKKLGVIVPYRNRKPHLEIFLPHMEKYLKKHNIDFHIYVIHQKDDNLFNKGFLVNTGFHITFPHVDYFCLHDVDTLVNNENNIYYYRDYPCNLVKDMPDMRRILGFIDDNNRFFGGVLILNKDHVIKTNGYSNNFWGWGGEDDNFLFRLEKENIINGSIKNYREQTGRFKTLSHTRETTCSIDINDDINNVRSTSGGGHKNYNNIILLDRLGREGKLDNRIDGYNQINYEILETRRLSDYATMYDIKNNNEPNYVLGEPMTEEFINTLLIKK